MKVLLVFVVACIVIASSEETHQLAEEVKDEEIEPALVGDGDEDAEVDVNNDAIDHDEIDLDHAQEDSTCKDFRADCEQEDCKKRYLQIFVNQYCQKTCNMCRGGYVITPHGGGSLHSACKDFRDDCKRRSKRGDCKKNYLMKTFMNQYCPKSCNVCRGGYVITPHGRGSQYWRTA